MDSDLLDTKGAMQFLGISRNLFFAELGAGRIPGRRIGRLWRFSRRQLLEVIEGRCPVPGDAAYIPPIVRAVSPEAVSKILHEIDGNGRGKGLPRHRGTGKLTPEQRTEAKGVILQALEENATMKSAAHAAGVSDVTLRNWKQSDPAFAALVEKAAAVGVSG